VKQKDWPESLIREAVRILVARRKAAEMTVYELSQRCGVTQHAIGYIEKETRRPTLESLAKISQGLGMQLSELFAEAEQNIR